MALAIDSQMPSSVGQSSEGFTTLTYAFNNVAGTLLLVGFSWGKDAACTVVSVTYNTDALTLGASIGYDGAGHNQSGAAIYYKLTPATGSHDVVITLSTAADAILSGAMSFTGHHLTTPIVVGSGNTNFRESAGTTATVDSDATTVGNIVVAQMATGSGYVSTAQTRSWSLDVNDLSAGGNGAMTYANGTGGVINFSDTVTSDFMGMVCVEVATGAAPPPAFVSYQPVRRHLPF
jgi:hypothetical protein